MHWTNNVINKQSDKFEGNESNFKKSLTKVLEIIKETEGVEAVDKLKDQMEDMQMKTLMVGW